MYRGKRFGHLVLLHKVRRKTTGAVNSRKRWRVRCDCGQELTTAQYYLVRKNAPKTHCGCKNKSDKTHFKREYHTWMQMKNRCSNAQHSGYKSYGGRGISVCDIWEQNFSAFLKDMGPKPTLKHSLDRIDPDGNYEPSNCRWVTIKTQARNKRNTKYVRHPRDGRLVKAADLADELGIPYRTLRKQLIDEDKWYIDV